MNTKTQGKMIEIFQYKSTEKFYFRVKAENGQVLCTSEGYWSKEACCNGAYSLIMIIGKNIEIKDLTKDN